MVAPSETGSAASAPPASWDAPTWNGEAQHLANLGQWQVAIACHKQALVLAPQDAAAWLGRGRCLGALGRLEEAIDCYSQAVAFNPQLATGWFSKALAEERIGRTQDAVYSYERYLAVASAQDAVPIGHARRRLRELGDGG